MSNTSIKSSQLFSLAFLIFAIFFGAGNLIFPPIIGFQSGQSALLAYIGFFLTAVVLPTVSVIAFAGVEGDFSGVTNKIGPKFTLIFTSSLYLLMGPLFVVPRTAIVAHEMSVVPFLPYNFEATNITLLIFSFIYFLIIYLSCVYSTKIMDVIGKYIVPLLLFIVLLLIIGAVINPLSAPSEPIGSYVNNPLFAGMVDGFLTMDSLGTIIIVGIVIQKLNELGVKDTKSVVRLTTKAGIIAGITLGLVYGGLAFIGATSDVPYYTTNGALILVRSANSSYGTIGMVFLAIVVLFACFTTAVTLIMGFGTYFSSIIPSISFKNMILIGTLFSFGVSNLGFDILLLLTVPVMDIAYPITILVVAFTLLRNHINRPTSIISMVVCVTISLAFVFYSFFNMNVPLFPMLPLFNDGLGWIIPTTIVAIITTLVTKKSTPS
jgi:branched-chain amino acid:cation transporter, LIVCS family